MKITFQSNDSIVKQVSYTDRMYVRKESNYRYTVCVKQRAGVKGAK